MDREIINYINQEVRKKREFSNISANFIDRIIIKYLKQKPYVIEHLKKYNSYKLLKKDPYFQEIVKLVRAKLHEVYSVFLPKSVNKLWRIIESDIPIEEKIIELLKQTRPTKERINFYRKIYSNIFIEKDSISILDLASGLNPISIYFSDVKPYKYDFVDLSPDIVYINSYILDNLKISNEGIEGDILDLDILPKKKYTFTFLWKTIPIIEDISPGYTKKIIENLNSKYIVISFSLRKLSGKDRMGKAWITWTRRLANNMKMNIVKEFYTPNEYFAIFYTNY